MDRHDIRLREPRSDELTTAVDVIACGIRDNPSHVAAFGDDPERRLRAHRRMFTGLFGVMRHEQLYRRHGFVVTGQADGLGTPNWFLERWPRPRSSAG